jgi:hypothetical protein
MITDTELSIAIVVLAVQLLASFGAIGMYFWLTNRKIEHRQR